MLGVGNDAGGGGWGCEGVGDDGVFFEAVADPAVQVAEVLDMFEGGGAGKGGGAPGESADGALGAFDCGACLARDFVGDGAGEATAISEVAVAVWGNRGVVGGIVRHCSYRDRRRSMLKDEKSRGECLKSSGKPAG